MSRAAGLCLSEFKSIEGKSKLILEIVKLVCSINNFLAYFSNT